MIDSKNNRTVDVGIFKCIQEKEYGAQIHSTQHKRPANDFTIQITKKRFLPEYINNQSYYKRYKENHGWKKWE